jgi:uncharacterized protein YlxW (UPF0749 family)
MKNETKKNHIYFPYFVAILVAISLIYMTGKIYDPKLKQRESKKSLENKALLDSLIKEKNQLKEDLEKLKSEVSNLKISKESGMKETK